MRAKSSKTNGYVIYAVSGTNTISFAIDFREANTKGLLGFAVERLDVKKGERKYMEGYKIFKGSIDTPSPDTVVSTYNQPVQSFVWDDFTCYAGTEYQYFFHPLKGKPDDLDRSQKSIAVTIATEKVFTNNEHDVFFNRGVASSQAYRRKFYNIPPDKMKDEKMKERAYEWLGRDLDNAILKFINDAKSGDTLLGCFYEFHYEPVVQALADAAKRKVKVKIIIDAKVNESTDKNGTFHESFPRVVNLKTIKAVGLDKKATIIKREKRPNDIQHNKFMVLLKKNKPSEVWTGSANISEGGIYGQTNVGHWIRNKETAEKYKAYWDILSKDPGAKLTDEKSVKTAKSKELKNDIEKIQEDIAFESWDDIPQGITPVFSPRSKLTMLETYSRMMDNAECNSCVTLAFGINKVFKADMLDNTDNNHLSFLLLEKEDKPNKRSKDPFVFVGAKQNVYKAWGAYLKDPLYQWAKETSTRGLGLNKHVAYIHSKFLLVDPLGSDPVVVTGSANFSEASTKDNDENMVVIRGNTRVSDIYFTEFNRLFNHYYFRAVINNLITKKKVDTASFFLSANDNWLKKYTKGSFKHKRILMYASMDV